MQKQHTKLDILTTDYLAMSNHLWSTIISGRDRDNSTFTVCINLANDVDTQHFMKTLSEAQAFSVSRLRAPSNHNTTLMCKQNIVALDESWRCCSS